MRPVEDIEYLADDDLTPEELAARNEHHKAKFDALPPQPEARHWPNGVDPLAVEFEKDRQAAR